MVGNFWSALDTLTLLAAEPENRLTSELIAASIGTNPVVVRRQLALLRQAGIVESKGAKGGGWLLTRHPKQIHLSEVLSALGEEASFRMHRNEPHPNCEVGQNVRRALEDVYADAETAVAKSLRAWTVEDMLHAVRSL
jgi:Rrf2 family protein